jgi:serine/threonine protein kinase
MSRELSSSTTDYCAPAAGMVPLRWTAPEVLKTRRHSTMSDVWSFGVLCGEVFEDGALVRSGVMLVVLC